MDMVAKQTWHRQLGDVEIPWWVNNIGKVTEVQTLKTENGGGFILYRVVIGSGAFRTVITDDLAKDGRPAILSNGDLTALAGLLLAAGASPDSLAYERFVEGPSDAELKAMEEKKAEAARAAAPLKNGVVGAVLSVVDREVNGAIAKARQVASLLAP